jgi:tyrosinase
MTRTCSRVLLATTALLSIGTTACVTGEITSDLSSVSPGGDPVNPGGNDGTGNGNVGDPDPDRPDPQAPSIALRRSVRSLSQADIEKYDAAFATLARNGTLGEIVDMHRRHGLHGRSSFLTWHRYFIYRFELEMRAIEPDIALPYWDWLSNPSLPPVGRATPGVEMPGGETMDVFRDGDDSQLADIRQGRDCVDEDFFDDYATCIEKAHNAVHLYVGGTMGEIPTSAADPLFWMHHSFVDRLWNQWMKAHPDAVDDVDVLQLQPWDVNSIDVLDLEDLDVAYAD